MQSPVFIHRLSLSVLLLTFATLTFAQQTGSINGHVSTADNKPAQLITVTLKGTALGTITNESGEYQIRRIKAGTYQLQVSAVGITSQEKTVTLSSGKTLTIDFTISETANQLDEVVVSGNKTNKFAKRQTDNVARMPITNLENAQVYNVITKELAQDQVAVNFRDILKNAPGVGGASTQNPLLGMSQLIIRGFSQIFTLKNGMQVQSNFAPDPATIEKLDVIKGPSATLFGAAGFGMSYGGFVNQETKKPYDTIGGEVSYSGGSYNLNRVSADVNLPLKADKTVLFRLNTAAQTENSFKNYGITQTYTINPSFIYKVTDRLTFRAEFDIQRNSLAGYALIDPIGDKISAKNWKDVKADPKSTYNSDALPSTVRYLDAFMQAEYKISTKWKSQTKLALTDFKTTLRTLRATLLTDSTLLRSATGWYDQEAITTNVQQNFIGDFHIGQMRNRLLTGADYLATIDPHQNLYGSKFNIDTLNYLKISEKLIGGPEFDAMAKAAGYDNYGGRFSSYIYGVYVSDVLNLTDNLVASAGLRFDSYKDETGVDFNGVGGYPSSSQTAFSPKFGLIYQPVKDRISLFANYQNGFANRFGVDKKGNRFKPEQANQLEGGIKAELASGLSGSVSYYDIKVKDVLRTDPADNNFSIQDADQRNRGIEADIIYNPFAGFNIVAGYGYVDGKYTRANPGTIGKRPNNIARHLANFWASYRILNGAVKGLGVGFGGNYTSDAYADDNNTFTIPGYTLIDGSIYYDQPKYRIGFKVNNITNTLTFNRYGAQSLRQVALNLTVKF